MDRSLLRSGKIYDSNPVLSEFDELIAPIITNIEGINKALSDLKKLFEEKFSNQQKLINNLLTRVTVLESKVNFNAHIAEIQERKIDDSEQFSRKLNLRLKGLR